MERFSNESRKFIGDLGVRAGAEGVGMICSILMFSLLARVLSLSDYAISNQLVTLGALIAPIILIKMNTAFCVFFPGERDKAVLKSRFFTIDILALTVSLIAALLLIIFRSFFSNLMFGTELYQNIMPIVAIYYVLLALATLSEDFFRAIGMLKISSVILVGNYTVKCVLLFSVFIFGGSITLKDVLLLYCGVEFLMLLSTTLGIFVYFKGIPLKLSFRPLVGYYKYTLPLMPYLVFSWINTSIGKFLLNHMMNLESSAVYIFNSSMVSRIFILNTVLGYTVLPYIARYWNEGKKEKVSQCLGIAFEIGMFFGIPFMFGLLSLQPTIVSLLGGDKYAVDRLLCAIFCINMLLNLTVSINGYLIDLSKKTIWFTIILFFTAVLSIIFYIILIPLFGIYGAALTLTVSYTVQAILTVMIGSYNAGVHLKIGIKPIVKSVISSGIMVVALTFIYNNSGISNFVISVLLGAITYFLVQYVFYILSKRIEK